MFGVCISGVGGMYIGGTVYWCILVVHNVVDSCAVGSGVYPYQ